MRVSWKKTIVLLEVILILFSFTGCWDYHELESYSVVSGMAVDKGQNGFKYHVTFECINISEGEQTKIKPMILEGNGNTIFEAVRGVLKETDKKLYFDHCHIIILSQELAKTGIRPLLDWIKRDAEPRLTIDVIVSKEKTAGEILKVKPQSNSLIAYQINSTLRECSEYNGDPIAVQVYEITNILNIEGLSLALPAVEKKETEQGGTVHFCGAAIFKGDRLTGWLNLEEEEFLNIVRGKTQRGLLLTGPTPGSTQICLEISKCRTKVTPELSGESLTINIDVNLETAFAEQSGEKDIFTEVGRDEVEKYAEQTLETKITNVVKYGQQNFDHDIFGFGNMLYQKDKKSWDRVKPKWNQMFKAAKVKVNAKVQIQNSGLNTTRVGDWY